MAATSPTRPRAVLARALCHADNCYFLPHVRLRGYPCRTNTVSNTAFRGFGGPQGMFGIETVIDTIARTLKLPIDVVRSRNFYGVGKNDVTPYLMKVEDNIIARVMDELDRAADLTSWRAEIDAFNRVSPVIKKGLATMPIKFGISFNKPALNQSGALVHVYTDGSVLLSHGGTEMGQGLFVKVAQVVAEAFQIDLGHIRLAATSTGKVPNTSPTAASSGSDLNGMAALNAATQIKDRMTAVAAEHFDVGAADIVFAGNRIYAGNRSLSFPELAAMSWDKRVSLSAAGYYKTPKIHWDFATSTGRPFFYFTYGAAATEVAIDTLTGETRVLRVELVEDCGRSLNPAVDLGQIEGGFVQGMGWLTSEELVWDEAGAAAHARPLDLQGSGQPRRAADLPRPPARQRAQPRGHHLPLQGGRRAAADAGDLGLARHPRRGGELRGARRGAAARRPGDAGAGARRGEAGDCEGRVRRAR